uniref:Transmembrane protein 131 n=1 Tax=Anthurium amnicola TaxID=1678845 RepID=A0A1D1XDR4_9ARAE
MAPGLPTSPSPHHHLICCRLPLHNGFCQALVLIGILFFFTLSWFSNAGKGNNLIPYARGLQESLVYNDGGEGCDAYEEGALSAVYAQKSSQGCSGVKNVFARSDSFCFLSTLPCFHVGSDSCSESLENPVHSRTELHPPLDELLDGTKVSCFHVETNSGRDEGFAPVKENFPCDDIGSCVVPLKSDARMRYMDRLDFPSYETSDEFQSDLPNGSLLPHINISPPFLDWGTTHLYMPSKVSLTVTNTHTESDLLIYEPFSTNSQYHALEFEQLSLAPGEATSIGFVFLPRWLGTSSAHLVLQTNFGGFVIHAKGTAVDSPYRIQPLVGFDVASDGRLSKKLSMYNSLDEVIYVEEVRALISISYENRSHTAHIVCQREPSDQPSGDFNMMLNGNKWFNLEHGEFGESFVGLSPHRLWELHPHNTESIIEINLFTHREGNFSGVLCMKYHGSSFGKNETIVVPLEAHVKDRVGYHTPSGSISVFLESASPCESQGSVFSLFVRNSASYLLRLVKVIEMTNTIKLFEVKYIQGLILYPGTVTHVALVIYSSDTNLMEISAGMPAVMSNCKLAIVTNDSVSPLIEVPCEDLVKTCLRHEARVGLVASEDSYVDMWLQHEEKQSTDAKTGSLGNTGEELFPIKAESAISDCLVVFEDLDDRCWFNPLLFPTRA